MIKKESLKFLSDLAKNNYREWFAENKHRYEAAQKNVLEVGSALFAEINKFDKNIIFTDPKKCMFRIYRDVRFSKNKDPYKTNIGMFFNPEGTRRCEYSAYYLHIEPKRSFVACGVFMPQPKPLKLIRSAADEDFERLSAILNNKEFKKTFGGFCRDEDALIRVPTGFDDNSPAAEMLKLKHFYVHHPFSDDELCGTDFVQKAGKVLKVAKPLQDWLNEALDYEE